MSNFIKYLIENSSNSLCKKLKNIEFISFPKGYPLDKISKFFRDLVTCDFIFYNTDKDPQPGYYILHWVELNKDKELCIRLVETHDGKKQVEYAWKSYYISRGKEIVDIKDIIDSTSTSKYVKQLKFEAYEPGQEPKEEIWKHYDVGLSVRYYNRRLYLYDYNETNLLYRDIKKLEGKQLKEIFKNYNVEGKSLNSYNKWNLWIEDLAIKLLNELKADFKDIDINPTIKRIKNHEL